MNSVRKSGEGGSPATEQIEMGLETAEVNQQMAMSEREPDETEENSELMQLSDTTSHCNSKELSTPGDQSNSRQTSTSCEDQSSSFSRKRREKLDETLATYKHKK